MKSYFMDVMTKILKHKRICPEQKFRSRLLVLKCPEFDFEYLEREFSQSDILRKLISSNSLNLQILS